MKGSSVVVTGKRKTAVAKATIKEGNGIVTFNRQPLSHLPTFSQLELSEPLAIAQSVLKKTPFDIFLNVKGGGSAAQIDAGRLAIAKAIMAYTANEELRQEYLRYDRSLIVADTRRKEACKPGDSKARARRQTSFR